MSNLSTKPLRDRSRRKDTKSFIEERKKSFERTRSLIDTFNIEGMNKIHSSNMAEAFFSNGKLNILKIKFKNLIINHL